MFATLVIQSVLWRRASLAPALVPSVCCSPSPLTGGGRPLIDRTGGWAVVGLGSLEKPDSRLLSPVCVSAQGPGPVCRRESGAKVIFVLSVVCNFYVSSVVLGRPGTMRVK